MLSAIYTILITPLIQIIEFFYQLFYEVSKNAGLSVIGLSFVVTICTLPLYMVAEQWQQKERQIQNNLKSGVNRIKNVYKGDEQYMILSTYYKQNHYHPIMALRSSFSLLIQIPFFIAAYNFLSNLEPLRGVSFLFIKDFGSPDATFKIGTFAVNILPIAMTVINCVAGAIYSKGHNTSEKVQIYACALVFLLLLYNSPAGLVVYWTMNNILSLAKNIFYKLRNPKKVLYILACAAGLAAIITSLCILRTTKFEFRAGLVFVGVFIPFIPLLAKYFSKFIGSSFKTLDNQPKLNLSLFLISAFILCILAGITIPSMLIESEPNQYCYIDSYKSPFIFIFITFYQALGLFVVWPACFYALFSAKTKKAFALVYTMLAFIAIINSFVFSGHYGPISADLIFMQPQVFMPAKKDILINFLLMAAVVIMIVISLRKFPKIVNSCSTIVLIALVSVSIKNSISIGISYSKMPESVVKTSVDPVFHLSKTGKNVIIIMQDRCFSPLVPYVFDESPVLKQKFDGFIFYPNTISFGKLTMIGTPGIFGGYDFTPFEINKRSNETLQQKHNQSILSMPVLFSENGWNTTVADMPYENYLEQPQTAMYKGYEQVNRVIAHGTYSDVWYKLNNIEKEPFMSDKIKRNFIWFGLFKMVPPALRQIIYHQEYWLSYNKYDDTSKFIDNYSEIDLLPELTDTNADKNSFIIIDNEATHESIMLQAPDYVPVKKVTQFGNSIYSHEVQFSAMSGIFLRLSEFFDYLKANSVYDNTKIIIVSDHGMGMNMKEFDNITQRFPFLKENVTATLLVKDFNSHGEIKTDNAFMTNADTPALAAKDLIKDAKNPFTGNNLAVENKNDYVKIVNAPAESTRIRFNTQFKIADDDWYTVKDNIFEDSNWSQYKLSK